MTLSSNDREWLERKTRTPRKVKLTFYFASALIALFVFSVWFFPEWVLTPYVSFFIGVNELNDGDMVSVMSEKIYRTCDGGNDCIVQKTLFFVSFYTEYENDSRFNELNDVQDTFSNGGDCDDFSSLFCALLFKNNLRCRIISSMEQNHAFSEVIYSDLSSHCFDVVRGIEIDCSLIEDGFVFYDSGVKK